MGQRNLPSNRDGFDEEFDSLRALDQRVRSNHDEFYTASLGSNMSKNRYREILPNEGTRVQLDPINNRGDGDYINANYVDGRRLFGVPFVYIATQSPLRSCIGDFWRMVYENQVTFVVMLCGEIENGKVKSERYWPDGIGGVMTMGPLTLTLLAENHRHDTIYRTIQLRTADGTEREIFHLQYVRWPDQGIPQTSAPLMEIIRTLGSSNASVRTPIVVHCSGGVGRTGVFIALHVVLAMFQTEQPISIPKTVQYLKFCRSGMVQRKDQYLFLYFAVLREMEKMIWSIESSRHAHGLPPQSSVPRAAIEDGDADEVDDERQNVRRRPPQHVPQHPLQSGPANVGKHQLPRSTDAVPPVLNETIQRTTSRAAPPLDSFGPTVQSGYYPERSSSQTSQSLMPLTAHGGTASDLEQALRNMQSKNQSQRRTPSAAPSRGTSQLPFQLSAIGGGGGGSRIGDFNASRLAPPPLTSQYEPSAGNTFHSESSRVAAVSTRLPLDANNSYASSPVAQSDRRAAASRGDNDDLAAGGGGAAAAYLPSPIERQGSYEPIRQGNFVSTLFGPTGGGGGGMINNKDESSNNAAGGGGGSRRNNGVEVRNIRQEMTTAADDDDGGYRYQQRNRSEESYFFSPPTSTSLAGGASGAQQQPAPASDLEAASRNFNASILGSVTRPTAAAGGGGGVQRSDVSLL
ncbi:tyrosine specific protein phosphatase, putative [Bodo saltans]|uniref:Tyrosine specific protein phosphatase, putative n=1 Tax=Bodo saltans TaxID=75058 RepID=A0A0S4IW29_BODSA|nr:tyrosine specific protein phosphatase, putative [Bodo saltans]|eukprot:CUG05979.1 tyrosine specific protein phosphatase, putative [Bodo saltans]